MRTAFFVLLFANLAFLAWAHWVDVPPPAPSNDAISRLPRLKLVGESPSSSRHSSTDAARKMALSVAAQPRCMSIGPFGDLTSVARASQLLREKGFDPRQRTEEGETSDGFWVYIGGLKSESDATRVLQGLERNGIRDAQAMPGADGARRISVGLFSDRERADRRLQAVRKMGFKPELVERKSPGMVYWVDVSLRPGVSTVPTQGLSSQAASSTIGVQSCPAGAEAQPQPLPPEPVAPMPLPAGLSTPPTTVAATPKVP